MIQLDQVHAYYAQLSDNELLHFVEKEAQFITNESHSVLLAEIKSRKFNIELVEQLETDKALEEIKIQLASEDAYTNAAKDQIWDYIISAMVEGKTDVQIIAFLVTQGLSKDQALLLLTSVATRSKQLADDSDTGILIGWALFFIGFTLLCFGFVDDVKWKFVFYGGAAFILGLGKLAIGFSDQRGHRIVVNLGK